jgi:selenocysteine lyase/cysteine desulfurase
MLAAGTIPLQLGALAELAAAQGRGGGRGNSEPLPPLGAAPALPDKASFPNIHGTYLNGASTHPRPAGAVDLIRKAVAAEIGESSDFRPNQDRIRQNFAKLVNADPTEVAFVPSTQIGESWFGAAIGLNPEKGSHVVSDHLHFIGSMQMYTDMAKRGLNVTWVKIKDNRIPLDDLDHAIVKGKTKLVAVSHTALVSGFQHDLKKVSEIAHAKGALVYADIIQGAGNVPLDLTAAGVDAACCATYKWLMSSGTAFLYVRKSSQDKLTPPFYHFSRYTRLLPTTHMYPFDAPGPDLVDEYEVKVGAPGIFATGYEPNTATLAGLEYTLPYVMNIGPDKIQAHAQTLTDRLKAELPKLGYSLMTPVDARSPIVTIAVKDAQRLNPALRDANVTVTTRWNHVRISPSVFNDMNDIERLLAAMPRVS